MEEFFEENLIDRYEKMLREGTADFFSADEICEICIYYTQTGALEEAKQATEYGLSVYPDNTDIKLLKAEVLLELDILPEAKSLLDEIKPMCEDTLDFQICMGNYFSKINEPALAIASYKRALSFGEELSFLHTLIGDEFLTIDNYRNAARHYRKALNDDPQDAYALESLVQCYKNLKEEKEALDFLSAFLEENPHASAGWIFAGNLHTENGAFKEAISCYNYAIALDEYSTEALTGKAKCFEAVQDWDTAAHLYKELTDMYPQDAYFSYKLGTLFKKAGKLAESKKYLQQCLQTDPQYYDAHYELSLISSETGDTEEALYHIDAALAMNPSTRAFLHHKVFLCLNVKRFSAALRCLETLCQIAPEHFLYWYASAEILLLTGAYQEARELLITALKLHNRMELWNALAQTYEALGETEKAQNCKEKAIRMGYKEGMKPNFSSENDTFGPLSQN